MKRSLPHRSRQHDDEHRTHGGADDVADQVGSVQTYQTEYKVAHEATEQAE